MTLSCLRLLRRYLSPCACSAAIAALLSIASLADAEEGGATPAPATVDFQRDVRPIFEAHCLRCHGSDRRAGGLRLDRRDYAQEGGDSGGRILGGTLDTNELYHRVASADIADRMPKSSPALSATELDVLRRWVEAGTPWSDPPAAAGTSPDAEPFIFRLLGVYETYTKDLRFLRPFLIAFMSLLVAWLLIERSKRAAAARVARGESAGRWGAASRHVRLSHFLAGCLLLSAGFAIATLADLYRQQAAEKDRLTREVEQLKHQLGLSASSAAIYGTPPVPHRPQHPRRLAGTYYRGNCERNPKLYNHGNYRTATFHIALCDQDGNRLDYGSPVPDDGLWVEFEMVRARGTTDTLFTSGIIDAIFLSEEVYTQTTKPLADAPRTLETVEPEWRWRARVPLASPENDGSLAGLIYVYKGDVTEETARGEPHYAIKYDLVLEDGRIAPSSEVWMNSVYWSSAIATPQPGKVPLDEWFDWRPLPEIEGENTTDPKLLGIDEHMPP